LIRVARGATGVWGQGDDPLPQVDVVAFKTACHAAAWSIRATVGEVTRAGVTQSFHTVLITASGIRSTVLCHEVLPAVAFVASPPQAGAPLADFTSPPAWADAFELGGFRLLDVGELAMARALVVSAAVGEASIDQPTTRRENVSTTTAQYTLPSRVGCSVMSVTHNWSRV
jgi:hypothetical protein